MDLAAHCQAVYVHADRRLDAIDCDAPVGGGHLFVNPMFATLRLLATGTFCSLRTPTNRKSSSLQVTLQHISAGFFLELLRHVHPGVAADASVSGEVNGDANCEWRGFQTLNACSGELRSTPLALSLPHVEQPLHLSPMRVSSVAVIQRFRQNLRLAAASQEDETKS